MFANLSRGLVDLFPVVLNALTGCVCLLRKSTQRFTMQGSKPFMPVLQMLQESVQNIKQPVGFIEPIRVVREDPCIIKPILLEPWPVWVMRIIREAFQPLPYIVYHKIIILTIFTILLYLI
jgi:hypothetical protein